MIIAFFFKYLRKPIFCCNLPQIDPISSIFTHIYLSIFSLIMELMYKYVNDIISIPCFLAFFMNSGCISPFNAINILTSESNQLRLLSSSSSSFKSFNLRFFSCFFRWGRRNYVDILFNPSSLHHELLPWGSDQIGVLKWRQNLHVYLRILA